MNQQDWIEKRTIFKCVSGSKCYGFSTPQSDTDIRGVCIPPKEFYFGMQGFEQQVLTEPDQTIYGIQKFVKLARDNNPNILELMSVSKPECLIFEDEYWIELKKNINLFICKRARHSFSGYAHAQLKRIKGHKVWLDNPPKKPEPESYLKNIETNQFGIDEIVLKTKPGHYFDREAYESAKKKYDQYTEWRNNRNTKRKEIEEKYHYDTKHGAHLIRLMKMCVEILKEKKVIVHRDHDKQLFIDIRNGKYTYEQVIEMSDELDAEAEKLYNESDLQHSPNDKKIDKLLVEITHDYIQKHG